MKEEQKKDKEIIIVDQEDILDVIEIPFRMGRPSKCTEQMIEDIVGYIRQGLTYKDTCEICGITYETFMDWRKRGKLRLIAMEEAEKMGVVLAPDEYEDRYVDFHLAVERAQPEQKLALLNRIFDAAKDPRNWTAAAWYLERRYPDEYGRKLKVEKADWRTKVLELIESGIVTFDDVAKEIGDGEAVELFERAGKRIPARVQSQEPDEER